MLKVPNKAKTLGKEHVKGSLRRKKKNKVEEIQLTNLASLGKLASNELTK